MIELKGVGKSSDFGNDLYRAYYSAAYRTTKAILAPVVVAASESFAKALTSAIKAGLEDAFESSWTIPFLSRKK